MARRAKLTQEMVDEAIHLKADGLSYGGIICTRGVHEPTFNSWIGDPKTKLQRELSEWQKERKCVYADAVHYIPLGGVRSQPVPDSCRVTAQRA